MIPIPTAIVPLDGSDHAMRAVRPALALAARALPTGERPGLLLLSCTPDDAEVAEAELLERVELFSEAADVTVRVVDEDPVEAILEAVADTPVAMLAMATHGRGSLRTAVLGSTADDVVRRCDEPVLLVGPSCTTTVVPGERARMVVTSDGSAMSEAVLPVAADWTSWHRLAPWLVEAIGPDEDVAAPGEQAPSPVLDDTRERLGSLAVRLRYPAATEVLYGLPADRSIVAAAHRLSAAVVAMATHGRSGILRTALGSVSSDVVRHAPCPVLVVRPDR